MQFKANREVKNCRKNNGTRSSVVTYGKMDSIMAELSELKTFTFDRHYKFQVGVQLFNRFKESVSNVTFHLNGKQECVINRDGLMLLPSIQTELPSQITRATLRSENDLDVLNKSIKTLTIDFEDEVDLESTIRIFDAISLQLLSNSPLKT